jgi:CheY-like chemotaxis protein
MHSSPCTGNAAGDEAAAYRRILLVEDDPEAAEFFRHTLSARGRFQVTHTPDPAAALALAAAVSWDLVITDLNLPGMSGTDLLAALRPLAPHLPIILVTADPDGLRCAIPPDALLTKPVPADTLLVTVLTLVGRGHRTARTA